MYIYRRSVPLEACIPLIARSEESEEGVLATITSAPLGRQPASLRHESCHCLWLLWVQLVNECQPHIAFRNGASGHCEQKSILNPLGLVY